MEIVPIDPTRTKGGSLVALVPHFGAEMSKPVELENTDDPYSNFRVLSNNISVSVATKLNVGSIFSGGGSASESGFYYDAVTYTDKYAEQPIEGQVVRATRWGVGIRVLLRVSEIKGNLSLNFGLVGAAVELQQAKAMYEVVGFGLGLEGLLIVLDDLPTLGAFTSETYVKLHSSVVKKLAKYIKEHADELNPQPIGVGLVQPIDPSITARTYYFAMRCIADRYTLSDALLKAGAIYDRDITRTVYLQIAGNLPDGQRPSKDAARKAEQWLEI